MTHRFSEISYIEDITDEASSEGPFTLSLATTTVDRSASDSLLYSSQPCSRNKIYIENPQLPQKTVKTSYTKQTHIVLTQYLLSLLRPDGHSYIVHD